MNATAEKPKSKKSELIPSPHWLAKMKGDRKTQDRIDERIDRESLWIVIYPFAIERAKNADPNFSGEPDALTSIDAAREWLGNFAGDTPEEINRNLQILAAEAVGFKNISSLLQEANVAEAEAVEARQRAQAAAQSAHDVRQQLIALHGQRDALKARIVACTRDFDSEEQIARQRIHDFYGRADTPGTPLHRTSLEAGINFLVALPVLKVEIPALKKLIEAELVEVEKQIAGLRG